MSRTFNILLLAQAEARRHDASLHVLSDLLLETHRHHADKDLLCRDIAVASLMLLRQRGGVFARLPDLPAAATSQLRDALASRPPCRFEVFERLVPLQGKASANQRTARVHVVLDIAHNPAAVAALVEKVKLAYPDTPIRYKMRTP
jgi:folylpolyglutamate synthase/dihydropteroate synthase